MHGEHMGTLFIINHILLANNISYISTARLKTHRAMLTRKGHMGIIPRERFGRLKDIMALGGEDGLFPKRIAGELYAVIIRF